MLQLLSTQAQCSNGLPVSYVLLKYSCIYVSLYLCIYTSMYLGVLQWCQLKRGAVMPCHWVASQADLEVGGSLLTTTFNSSYVQRRRNVQNINAKHKIQIQNTKYKVKSGSQADLEVGRSLLTTDFSSSNLHQNKNMKNTQYKYETQNQKIK